MLRNLGRGLTLCSFLLVGLTSRGCEVFTLLGSHNSQNSQAANVTVVSNNLINTEQGTIHLALTAHRIGSDSLFGSGHIQKPGDSTFYSEFQVTGVLLDSVIMLTAEIDSAYDSDFVGVVLNILARNLGNDHNDEVVLTLDVNQKLGTPVEFAGPGLVVIAPGENSLVNESAFLYSK